MTALTAVETIEFEQLESCVEAGLKAFYQAGQALKVIRDKRLYRAKYETFEDYCRERWNIGRQRASEFIQASEVIKQLSEISDNYPVREAHADAIAKANLENPKSQLEAWNAAQTIAPNNKPTAQHIQRAATAVKAKPEHLQPGQKVTVADENSPHYRQSVEVVESTGVIVQAKTEEGETVPFLVNELTTENTSTKPSTETTWLEQKPKQKPSHYETLELENEILKQRCTLLEEKLTEAIELLQQRDSTAQIRSFVSEVQNLMA